LRAQQRDSRIVGVDDPEADVMGAVELYSDAAASGLQHLFDRIDLRPAIERGLRGMQDEYRSAVVLVDIDDYTYADAVAILGVPIGTVGSRLFRGRRLLQQTLIAYATLGSRRRRQPRSATGGARHDGTCGGPHSVR
jgi:RNA polymerase sigma-70 factor (ECF subfamily)